MKTLMATACLVIVACGSRDESEPESSTNGWSAMQRTEIESRCAAKMELVFQAAYGDPRATTAKAHCQCFVGEAATRYTYAEIKANGEEISDEMERDGTFQRCLTQAGGDK